jgi:eukaryotic-like serine/threonine-protein kinase
MPNPDALGTRGEPDSRLKPGDVIADKYVVERILASGGMGVVLAAQHKQLRRRVALKFLLPELCQAGDVVARFLREAQAMTTIQNEHVVRVLDVGTTAEGSPFMVMEYLEGEDLGQLLERRLRLPVEETVDYVLQAMEALAEAHVNGFVHRDLKPSNLFVTQRPDGSPLVKVLDFGISKVISDTGGADLTHSSGILGTPLYMAPEQIRSSRTVDVRADIWTLGVIVHELLAGAPPFQGEAVSAVLASIVADDPPSLPSIRQDVPAGLADVVLRCLKKSRDDRYATVAELATALRPYASREGQLSVERIERIVAHHRRLAAPVDSHTKTRPRGLLPLEVTAHDPQKRPSGRPPGEEERAEEDASAGATFGKYKLLAILGQGSLADVFLAVLGGPDRIGLTKLLVIKRLRPNLAEDPDFVSMLVDEARIAAKLSHPNVIQTHEVGVVGDEYYLAMEYLDGQPLDRIVQRSRRASLPLTLKLGIVRDMLAGLHHAHELVDFDGTPLGLVHRDVNPQNVFVTYEGQVKVVDFGIAKAKGRATQTRQGIVKGKVGYMAPEQAGAKEIDRRADVFAAGVILWELLTGERLWNDLDDVAIRQKLLLDTIPSSPRAANPEVPKALDAIVRKALARERGDRFDTAQAFQVEIERYMETAGLACTPRDLGECVGALFETRRKHTRRLIEAQLVSLRSVGVRSSGSKPATADSGFRLERLDHEPAPEEGAQPDPVMARSNPGRTNTPTWASRARSRWALAAGAGLAIATALAVGAFSREKATPYGISPTVASAGPPAPEAPTAPPGPAAPTNQAVPTGSSTPAAISTAEPRSIRVTLTSKASGAAFAVDGEPQGGAPVAIERPRDGAEHRITATAPGYRPASTTVTFDEDVVWDAPLVRIRPEGPPPRPTVTAASTGAHGPTTRPSASAAPGPRRRELDPESPYAGQ